MMEFADNLPGWALFLGLMMSFAQSIYFQRIAKVQFCCLMNHVCLFPGTAPEAESGKKKAEEVIKRQAHNKIFSFT